MPPDASDTREKLLDAATRSFAEHGIYNASLIDITRQAGQRNRSALSYHFGSRDGVLCAVLERHVDFLCRREHELLAEALRRPGEPQAVVEAVVRPAAELAESGWRGRCCLLIIAEIAGIDEAQRSPELMTVLERTGGYAVFAELTMRMAYLPDHIRDERFALMTVFVLRAIADRARALSRRRDKGRAQLEYEPFVCNLVRMATAMISAPVAATVS